MRQEMISEALWGYVHAARKWRADGGQPFEAYVRRGIAFAVLEMKRRHAKRALWERTSDRLNGVADRRVSDTEPPMAVLRRIAALTNWRSANAAWMKWGLDLPVEAVARALGVKVESVWWMLTNVRREMRVAG